MVEIEPEFPYLTSIRYRHIGPLNEVDITPRFDGSGNPIPIFFVGENGSGKSVLLSNIADSFFEIGMAGFSNATNIANGVTREYFKVLSYEQVKLGEDYLYVRLRFSNDRCYVFKTGEVAFQDMMEIDPLLENDLEWKSDDISFKKTSFSKKESESFFQGNAICYFGPNRYEQPNWLGGSYFMNLGAEGLSNTRRFQEHLETPIQVENCLAETTRWILDLIADSRVDIEQTNEGTNVIVHKTQEEMNNVLLFGVARKHVEEVMSNILGESIYFDLVRRGTGGPRLRIRRTADDSVVVSSLDALSTGQLALFELFATIVRYADAIDVNKSIQLSTIKGIVVIDEVDLHLHVDMQKKALPRLIKLFPGVQFLLSTHAPLVLLGMQEVFGTNNFDIVSLPEGAFVKAEDYSQFEAAYLHIRETERFRQELRRVIDSADRKKPLVITEGTTDWRHMEAARAALAAKPENEALFEKSFDFLRFGAKEDADCETQIDMGGDRLARLCEEFALLDNGRTLIFIADRDKEQISKKLASNHKESKTLKAWGNNVFSLLLPIPTFREATPEICIEQMYTDDVIKTVIECPDGVKRRLFLRDEFSSKGSGPEGFFCSNIRCLNNAGSAVLDGSKVDIPKYGEDVNYALTKVAFANAIRDGEVKLANGAFDVFVPLFEQIQEAINSSN